MIYIIFRVNDENNIKHPIGWVDNNKYPLGKCINELEIKAKGKKAFGFNKQKYPIFFADSLQEITTTDYEGGPWPGPWYKTEV